MSPKWSTMRSSHGGPTLARLVADIALPRVAGLVGSDQARQLGAVAALPIAMMAGVFLGEGDTVGRIALDARAATPSVAIPPPFRLDGVKVLKERGHGG